MIEKAKQIIANAEKIKQQNSQHPIDSDKRRDFCYTSYAWATNILRNT